MSVPKPELVTLDNGVRIVTEPMPGAQSAVITLRFTFGAKDDPMDRLGIARIAEDVAFKGTPSMDAHAIFDAFDSLGVRRGSSTAVEYTQFQAQIRPMHFEKTVALYHDILSTASFPDEEVDVSKQLTLEELKRLEDNPIQQAMYLTFKAALGDPMGRLPMGEPETLALIGATDVRSFWTSQFDPARLIVSVAGGLEHDQIVNGLRETFGTWESGSISPEEDHIVTIADKSVHHDKVSEQEHIGMVFGSVPRRHEQYYAAQVAVAILSGSGSSRLFTEVREKRGLAYSVSAFYRARRTGGMIALYAGTTADRAQETLDVCRAEITRLAEDVTQEELERAKTVIKGGLFTAGDLPEGRAGSLAEDVFLQGEGRSLDDIAMGIDSVTLDQIPAYLSAYPPEPRTLVTLGPKALD